MKRSRNFLGVAISVLAIACSPSPTEVVATQTGETTQSGFATSESSGAVTGIVTTETGIVTTTETGIVTTTETGEVVAPPRIDLVLPGIVDPLGLSRVRVTGAEFTDATEVTIGGVPVAALVVVDEGTLELVTAPTEVGQDVPMVVTTRAGEAVANVEVWSPAELDGARVFDAAFGVEGTEPESTYQWARLTESIDPMWLHRDGPGLVWLPDTERFWMLAGWSPYEPPDGWGEATPTTNEVWSSADGVSWTRELEHGHDGFDPRHFAGTLRWHDRAWQIGGDIFLSPGTYQHDIVSSADGVNWTVEVAQTPWSDRIFEVAGIYEDEMWVVGGQTGLAGEDPMVNPTVFHNDVWRSADGVTWTEVVGDAPASATRWSGRGMASKLVEFQGRLWLVGGGTYDTPDQPTRQFFNEVWSTTDGVEWTEHTPPPWSPRQYHTVEIFDDRLWVIGGNHEITSNSNDAWYSDDGESWTEIPWQRSPLPVSHGDGVAVGPDFLLFAGGNYTFGVGLGPDNSAWRLRAFRGTLVQQWVDRGSAGLSVIAQAVRRPVLDPNALGPGIPGLVFDGLDHGLELEASDIQPDGRSVFFVAQSPFNPTVADLYSPADTIVGDSVSPFCAAGLSQGAITYTEGSLGWQSHTVGSGYQDGVGAVFDAGFSHAADGTIQAWGHGLAIGPPVQFGYTPDYEGWRTIGGSLGYSSSFVGALGAVIIVPAAVDAATAAKIHAWAQGRFLPL